MGQGTLKYKLQVARYKEGCKGQGASAGSRPVCRSTSLPVGEKYKRNLVFSRWYLVFSEEKTKRETSYKYSNE